MSIEAAIPDGYVFTQHDVDKYVKLFGQIMDEKDLTKEEQEFYNIMDEADRLSHIIGRMPTMGELRQYWKENEKSK